jgi:hypothetical protein
MKVEDLKAMDPFQAHLLMFLERIAKSLEQLVETDNDR